MRVLVGMEQDGGPQARQRGQTPARGLVLLGHHVDTASHVWCPTEISADQVIRGMTTTRRITQPADVAIIRLVDVDETESIVRARRNGQVVLFDWDDDVWHLPEWNPAHKWLKRGGRFVNGTPPLGHYLGQAPRSIDLDLLEANMAACDAVIASTPALADVIREVLDDVPVYVCRNGVDAGRYRWPRRPVEHDPLRVAWLGTMGYGRAHLETIAEALVQVSEEFPAAEFWHLGYEPGEELVEEVLAGLAWPVVRRPWVRAGELGDVLREVDLAVVPRVPCPFTEAQSNMTGLSLAAAGVPFVATGTAEYVHLAEARGGFTAQSVDDWVRALRFLFRHEKLRHTSAASGREAVVDRYNPRATALQYLRVFSLVGRARQGGLRRVGQ